MSLKILSVAFSTAAIVAAMCNLYLTSAIMFLCVTIFICTGELISSRQPTKEKDNG